MFDWLKSRYKEGTMSQFLKSRWVRLFLVLIVLAFLLSAPSGKSQALDETQNAKGLKVTVLMFSGRPNPVYFIQDEQVISDIKGKVGKAQAKGVAKGTAIPSRLGYNGIVVENPGGIPGLPRLMVVHKQNILEGEQNNQFADDGSLENVLLDQALLQGAIDQKGHAYIKSDKGQ